MRNVYLIFVIIVAFLNLNAGNVSNKLDSYSKKILMQIQSHKQSDIPLLTKQYGYPFEAKDNKVYLNLFVEVNPNRNLSESDFQVVTKAGNILHLKAEMTKIKNVLDDPAVVRAAIGRRYCLHLDSARSMSKADLVHNGTNLPRGYTGKDVVIGIFDTGIDLLHPDFKVENGTRVLFLWDMADEFSAKPPQGYDWGREYTKAEIDENPESVLQKDLLGHGTHVAGIASGNGRGKSEFIGFAPEADLIIVNGYRNGSEAFFSDADILAACNYIFSKADELGKPCVINLSLGSILGSHDNEDLLGKALSNLVSEKKGRAIVASAGNEGELLIHTGGEFQKGNRYELLLFPINLCSYEPVLCPDIPDYFLFGADVWTDIGVIDSIYVGIYEPGSVNLIDEKGFSSRDVIDRAQIFNSSDNLVGLVSITNSSIQNSENFMIFISNEGQTELPIDSYIWSIVFVAKGNGRFDSWAALPIGSQEPFPSRYQRLPADNSMTISSPAVGDKIVSVGAYISKNRFLNIFGELEDWSFGFDLHKLGEFSSRGPSRDGRILPIITAPGMVVVSAFSSSTDPEEVDSALIDPSGSYIANVGTSMSAPCVTGAIALLLEQNPNLSIDEIIELLKISAKTDASTGNVPNNNFGWGKLDVLRLLQLVTEVNEQINKEQVSILPNPANEQILVASRELIENIAIYDILGNVVKTTSLSTVSVADLPKGLYVVRVKTSTAIYSKPLIVN